MSVVIVDIDSKRSSDNETFTNTPEVNERMLSLEEYMKIARFTIGRFAPPSMARKMLKDEDAISFIVEHLIKGTIKWEEGKGRTFKSYLNQRAIWAIKRWIENEYAAQKSSPTVSLDYSSEEASDNLYSVVADTKVTDFTSSNPSFDELIDKPFLNEIQKQCLKMKFVDGMTYREIGSALGKTFQRVEQIVSAGLQKLKNELQEI